MFKLNFKNLSYLIKLL